MTRPGGGRNCRCCGTFLHPQRSGAPRRSTLAGRGLCTPCWEFLASTGELADYERAKRSRDDLLHDYEMLRKQGYTWRQCAEKLRMTYGAFERAMLRARRAGDPRARRIGELNYPPPAKPALQATA